MEGIERHVGMLSHVRIEDHPGASDTARARLRQQRQQVRELQRREPALLISGGTRAEQRKELLPVRIQPRSCFTQVNLESHPGGADIGAQQRRLRIVERDYGLIREWETAVERRGDVEAREEVSWVRGEPRLKCPDGGRQRPRIVSLQAATEQPLRKNCRRARILWRTCERTLARGDRKLTLVWMKRVRVC